MSEKVRMPTAPKLIAALCFAGLGWVASDMIRPLFPEETNFGAFNYVNVVLGLLCGWIVTGPRVGSGWSDGISAGLTGVGALVFWGLFVQAFNEMLRLALDRKYDGPVEAILSVFQIGIEYGQMLINGPLIGTLIVGGIVIGLVAEWASHRWS